MRMESVEESGRPGVITIGSCCWDGGASAALLCLRYNFSRGRTDRLPAFHSSSFTSKQRCRNTMHSVETLLLASLANYDAKNRQKQLYRPLHAPVLFQRVAINWPEPSKRKHIKNIGFDPASLSTLNRRSNVFHLCLRREHVKVVPENISLPTTC